MQLMKSFNDKSHQKLDILYENTTKDFDKLEQKIRLGLDAINGTDRFLQSFKQELKRELNEYAIKVRMKKPKVHFKSFEFFRFDL